MRVTLHHMVVDAIVRTDSTTCMHQLYWPASNRWSLRLAIQSIHYQCQILYQLPAPSLQACKLAVFPKQSGYLTGSSC